MEQHTTTFLFHNQKSENVDAVLSRCGRPETVPVVVLSCPVLEHETER